jgi:hypothetical protein
LRDGSLATTSPQTQRFLQHPLSGNPLVTYRLKKP